VIEARRDVRTLKFWYAASSTGQEPCSVAMLIDDAFPELLQWDIGHLATDISRRSLERAAAGSYSQLEVSRGLPSRLLVKYFEKRGASSRISQRIPRSVTFRELNLNARWPWLPTFDVVFLRNVMIYFDVASRLRILDHVHEVLRPDGSLFLGGAETTLNLHDRFARVPAANAGCYQPLANASL
jgi:chemotaxis protein methyltransferase CheR